MFVDLGFIIAGVIVDCYCCFEGSSLSSSKNGTYYCSLSCALNHPQARQRPPTLGAVCPWDPLLADDGRVRVFSTGDKLRKQLLFSIHWVFVSPILRCLQTVAEAVSAHKKSDDPCDLSSNAVVIDPSKIKACENQSLLQKSLNSCEDSMRWKSLVLGNPNCGRTSPSSS